jgi:hypothetical protein
MTREKWESSHNMKGIKVGEERKDQITKVLSSKGALGVNALARETGINVSTLQKYLISQSYFRQNERKQWDLPERVTSDIRHNQLEMLATVAEGSIGLIRANVEELLINIDNALSPLKTLKRDIARIQLPVAQSVNVQIHPLFQDILDKLEQMPAILKSGKDKVNPEMYDILVNTDWHKLVLEMGSLYFSNTISGEIYNLILGETDILSEDALTTVKEYQKE